MIFEEKTIILKDGRTAILKSPCVEDAEKLLNYIKKSCSETDFLARYPEEWTTTIGQEEAWVNRLRSAPDTLGCNFIFYNQYCFRHILKPPIGLYQCLVSFD